MPPKKKVVIPQPGQGIPAVVDPNPARTASDEAEDVAETADLAAQAAVKQEGEQAHADRVQVNAQDELDQHNAEEEAADLAFENLESDIELIQQIMAAHGASELHENSKGEYFFVLNLAINSEGGNKDRVKTHNA